MNLLPFEITPVRVMAELARKARSRRLLFNYTQEELAERTGEISLRSFLEIAYVLDEMRRVNNLFEDRQAFSFFSAQTPNRQRARKRHTDGRAMEASGADMPASPGLEGEAGKDQGKDQGRGERDA